jgi:hypothetical protein
MKRNKKKLVKKPHRSSSSKLSHLTPSPINKKGVQKMEKLVQILSILNKFSSTNLAILFIGSIGILAVIALIKK